jgi:hypothetical protein
MKMKISTIGLGSLCALALTLQVAKANSIVDYSLNALNIPNYTGPYGQVEVNLISSTAATVTFTGLNGYQFVDGSSAALSVNASSFNFTVPAGFSVGHPLPGNVDGWGSFNLILDEGNSSNPVGTITFNVTNVSGSWGSDAHNVLSLNGVNGYFAAAHIITPDGNSTGYASSNVEGGGSPQVPDGGSTVALLGCALAGLGAVGRRFRK